MHYMPFKIRKLLLMKSSNIVYNIYIEISKLEYRTSPRNHSFFIVRNFQSFDFTAIVEFDGKKLDKIKTTSKCLTDDNSISIK